MVKSRLASALTREISSRIAETRSRRRKLTWASVCSSWMYPLILSGSESNPHPTTRHPETGAGQHNGYYSQLFATVEGSALLLLGALIFPLSMIRFELIVLLPA